MCGKTKKSKYFDLIPTAFDAAGSQVNAAASDALSKVATWDNRTYILQGGAKGGAYGHVIFVLSSRSDMHTSVMGSSVGTRFCSTRVFCADSIRC